MSEQRVYPKGTWLRFYQAGRFVIGQVEYWRKDVLGYIEYMTDSGTIREDCVSEAREATP